MTDTLKLTPEERDALRHLVQSDGWYIVMRELLLPQMERATQHLDAITGPTEQQTCLFRGIKFACVTLIRQVYLHAGRPDPLEQHTKNLLASMRQSTDRPWDIPGVPTVSHWIIQGRAVCGYQPVNLALMGATSRDHITCPQCRTEAIDSPVGARLSPQAFPV